MNTTAELKDIELMRVFQLTPSAGRIYSVFTELGYLVYFDPSYCKMKGAGKSPHVFKRSYPSVFVHKRV